MPQDVQCFFLASGQHNHKSNQLLTPLTATTGLCSLGKRTWYVVSSYNFPIDHKSLLTHATQALPSVYMLHADAT